LCSFELQKRLNRDPVLSNISILGVDPGGMPSGLTRRGNLFLAVMNKAVVPVAAQLSVKLSPNGPLRTTKKSAADVLRAALDTKELGERPKNLYLNGTDAWEASAEARDATKQEQLWKASVKYTNLQAKETALVNLG
jgi:hypothetical protein